MRRRDFVGFGMRAAGLAALGQTGVLLGACGPLGAVPGSGRERLPRMGGVSPDGLTLVARRTTHRGGMIWTFNDGPVGPTIEARRGDRARILLENELSEPTIVHWHGFRPPEAADGHPRFAVPEGGTYEYDFVIDEPAGLYWYHPHPHHRTAAQTYMGMAGLIVVRDEVEDRLGLPSGDREIAVIVQDRQVDASGRFVYDPRGHDMMEGYLGHIPVINGVPSPTMEVTPDLHRVRVVNGTNARILRLGLSTGDPITAIGGDAGFLPEAVTLPHVDLGTAERADLLVDFSTVPAGSRVVLQSLPFDGYTGRMGGMMRGMRGMGRGMGMMGGGLPQGEEIDLVEFVVAGRAVAGPLHAVTLPAIERLSPERADRRRTFRLQSAMMQHGINGRSFGLDRVDEEIPFGSTEVWEFFNDSDFPHAVHMHATHFQVVKRTGGREGLLPWESGWKDTVLTMPGERVEVVARFDRHRGIYLLHCHNLEHEDMGMMLNFRIV